MALFLYYGNNDVDRDEAARELRSRFDPADVAQIDGRDVAWSELSAACRTAGLFDPERLIIVHRLQDRLKGKRESDIADLAEILGSIAPTTTVLLVGGDLSGDSPLVKETRKAGGEIRTFAIPKARDLARWIARRAGQHRASIAPDAADLLAELVGPNPLLLDNELEKLATYVGPQGTIGGRDVELLVGAIPQDSIFALVDAVAAGQQSRALTLLHTQLANATGGSTDFALYLIRMLARQVRILLRIHLGRDARRSRSQIVADLKLPGYYADRYFRQAERLSAQRLARTFEQLASLEHGLKSGKIDAAPGLDLLVADLCG